MTTINLLRSDSEIESESFERAAERVIENDNMTASVVMEGLHHDHEVFDYFFWEWADNKNTDTSNDLSVTILLFCSQIIRLGFKIKNKNQKSIKDEYESRTRPKRSF